MLKITKMLTVLLAVVALAVNATPAMARSDFMDHIGDQNWSTLLPLGLDGWGTTYGNWSRGDPTAGGQSVYIRADSVVDLDTTGWNLAGVYIETPGKTTVLSATGVLEASGSVGGLGLLSVEGGAIKTGLHRPNVEFITGSFTGGDIHQPWNHMVHVVGSGCGQDLTPTSIFLHNDDPLTKPGGFQFTLDAGGVSPLLLSSSDPIHRFGDFETSRIKIDGIENYAASPDEILPLISFTTAATDDDMPILFPEAWFDYDTNLAELIVDNTGARLKIFGAVVVVPGDLSGDGDVDIEDVGLFEMQFGSQAPGAYTADFDEDQDVDLDDFKVMRDNLGAAGSAPQGGAATPEPATMTVLALGGMLVLRRRSRKA